MNQIDRELLEEIYPQVSKETKSKLENKYSFLKENKTVKQWLETLEEPYRSQALVNMKNYSSDFMVNSLVNALYTGFFWNKSPEGFDYWVNFKDSLC